MESIHSVPIAEPVESITINNVDNLLNDFTNENKINNLDILTEQQLNVNRVKKKQDTLEILQNSEKTRLQNRKKQGRYLFK